MYEAVYLTTTQARRKKGAAFDREPVRYYVRHPDRLPESMREIAEADGKEQAACDYIAGMTDRFAVDLYSNLFIPKAWGTPV